MRMQQERIESGTAGGADARRTTQAARRSRRADAAAEQSRSPRHRDQYLIAQKELDTWEGKHYARGSGLPLRQGQPRRPALRRRSSRSCRIAPTPRSSRPSTSARREHVQDLQLRLQEVTRDARRRQGARRPVAEEDQGRRGQEERADRVDRPAATNSCDTVDMSRSTNWILNLPMLDFVNPTLKIDQVVLTDLFVDMNYMHVPRVDRCRPVIAPSTRPASSRRKKRRGSRRSCSRSSTRTRSRSEKRKETEERIAQLKRIQDAPHDILNPWRTHPEARHLRRLRVAASAPRVRLHRLPSRPGPRHGVRPRRPHAAEPEDGAALGGARRASALLPGAVGLREAPLGIGRESVPRDADVSAAVLRGRLHQVPRRADGRSIGGERHHQGDADRRAVRLLRLPQDQQLALHRSPQARARPQRHRREDDAGMGVPLDLRAARLPLHDAHAVVLLPAQHDRSAVPAARERAEHQVPGRRDPLHRHAISSPSRRIACGRRPRRGDAARGKQLVESVGCLGCHIDSETMKDEKSGQMRLARRDDFPLERNYGFNLTGVGTKTQPGWIFNWVKNPKNYYADAPMPSLRLTDQEAADVTAYLMTLQKPAVHETPIRPARPEGRARARQGLSDQHADRSRRRGEAARACRCRTSSSTSASAASKSTAATPATTSSGFEGLKPIGTELTIEGSKTLHLFDFGFAIARVRARGREARAHPAHRAVVDLQQGPQPARLRRPAHQALQRQAEDAELPPLARRRRSCITTVVLGLTKDRSRRTAWPRRTRSSARWRRGASASRSTTAARATSSTAPAAPSRATHRRHQLPAARSLAGRGARAVAVPLQLPQRSDGDEDPAVAVTCACRPSTSTIKEANTLVAFFAGEGKAAQFDTHARPHAAAAERGHRPRRSSP